MIGQKNNIDTIIQWRLNKAIPRFILIEGATGSGRLTLAKVIMKMLNATGIIVGNSIDDVREVINNSYNITTTTLYIFRDADNMSVAAKNSLLKVVEEPPNNAYFIMTISSMDNMLNTIKSRATHLKMQPYAKTELKDLCNNDVLDYVNNIYEAQTIDSGKITELKQFCKEVNQALLDKSCNRLLKCTSKLNAKITDNNIDPVMFMRVFEKSLPNQLLNNTTLIEINNCHKYMQKSNKKAAVECMLLNILEELKQRGD